MRMLLVASLAFALGCSSSSKSPPPGQPPQSGTQVGARVPDAQLTDPAGGKVALAGVLHRHARSVVVFYRGFW